jgi:hypothetical protein
MDIKIQNQDMSKYPFNTRAWVIFMISMNIPFLWVSGAFIDYSAGHSLGNFLPAIVGAFSFLLSSFIVISILCMRMGWGDLLHMGDLLLLVSGQKSLGTNYGRPYSKEKHCTSNSEIVGGDISSDGGQEHCLRTHETRDTKNAQSSNEGACGLEIWTHAENLSFDEQTRSSAGTDIPVNPDKR